VSPQPPETSNGTQKMSSRVIIQSSPIAIPVPSQLFGTRPPAEGASAAKMPPFAYSPMEIGKACGGGGGGGGKTPSSKQKWEQAEDETIEDNYLTMAQIESDSDAEEDDMGTIAGYCVEELIGTGAFARVFVGRHPATWNKVAIKQVLKVPVFASGPVHEFTMVKRVKHKNIVEAIACVEDAGEQFLIFEMADEGDLYDRLEVSGDRALTRGACRRYLRQAAEALAHCHANNIVHGDVKLENMLLHQGAVKLCDFGLAAVVNEIRVGRPYGTSAYMAPELVEIRSKTATYKMTPSCDIWGMGIVLYAVLFNDLPWEKAVQKDEDYTYVVEHGGVVAGPKHFGSLAPGMRALMAGMLHPDPAQRIPMAELVEFLSESRPWFATDEPGSPTGQMHGGFAGETESVDSASLWEHGPSSMLAADGEDDALLACSWDEHRSSEAMHMLGRSIAVGHRRSSSLSEMTLMKKKLAGDPSVSTTAHDLHAAFAAMSASPLAEDAHGRRDSANF